MLSPQETLYQRLLARDPEEAAEQAEDFASDQSIDAFFDDVAIPALLMAQGDSDRGALDGHRRAVIAEGFAAMLDNLAEDGVVELGEQARTALRSSASPAATSSIWRRPGCCSICCACAGIAAPCCRRMR